MSEEEETELGIEGTGTSNMFFPLAYTRLLSMSIGVGDIIRDESNGMIYKVRRYNEARGGWELSWVD